MQKNQMVLVSLGVLLVAGLGFFFLKHSGVPLKPPEPSKEASVRERSHHWADRSSSRLETASPAFPVEVATVQKRTMPQHLKSIGVLKAIQSATISAEMAGKILHTPFSAGSLVKKGQLLIQLDAQIYEANLQAAKAALKMSEVTYHRYQQLAKIAAGVEAKQSLDQAQSQYLQDVAKVKVNEALLAETQIRAPFEGYVGALNVSEGDFIQPGQALTTLVRRDVLQAVYHLPEKTLNKIQRGQAVQVLSSEASFPSAKGQVSYIAPMVDPATHSVEVQATISNVKNQLAPGLFVQVIHQVQLNEAALAIPEQSLVSKINGLSVFVVIDHHAYSRMIQTGASQDGWVTVKSGLQAGEQVVISGQPLLKEGSLVRSLS